MSIPATELVFRILRDSDPQDIIRWRTVSKWFHAITCDAVLWRVLYKKSPFPRPSGPLPTQSVSSLERTLVKAAQLARSWTTRPMRAVSTTTCTVGSAEPPWPLKLISGRWLVVCESRTRFVLHDLDPRADTHTSQVFWQLEKSTVGVWDIESVESVNEECLVYLLVELSDLSWKLLQFRLNVDTSELYDATAVLDSPKSRLRKAELDAGNSHFLFIPTLPRGLVFDTRTCVSYELPRLHDMVLVAWNTRIIFTDTHLIFFFYTGSFDASNVIHVFTPPPYGPPGGNDQRNLCHTHRGQTNDGDLVRFKAMKPSIDPATGATNMRLIDYHTHPDALQLVCVDLTLPKRSTTSTEILPITVEERRISIPRDRVRLSRYETCCQYLDISDDGHIRGFYRGKRRQKRKARAWDPIESQDVLKFAIDTTQDPWAITRGPIAPAEWSEEVDPGFDERCENIVFDGMRGKLCYHHDDEIMVVDIE